MSFLTTTSQGGGLKCAKRGRNMRQKGGQNAQEKARYLGYKGGTNTQDLSKLKDTL